MKRTIPAAIILVLLSTSCSMNSEQTKALVTYPETRKTDQVDDYHGTLVSDPYRWLENDTSAETARWVGEENKVTYAYLQSIPFRDKIRKRLDDLLNFPRESAPRRAGKYYFFHSNSGLQNQDVLNVKLGLDGPASVFIDPNTFSEDGTVSFNIVGFSEDDRYVVLSRSEAGSDWSKLITYEIETKMPTGDTLNWVKFSGASWHKNGFYYSRFPEPVEGSDYSASNSFHSVYYHTLGEKQADDILIFRDDEHANRYHWCDVTEDGAYLLLYVAEGTDGNECYYKSLSTKGEFIPLFTGFENKCAVVTHKEGRFLVETDIDAPNYQLISIDAANASRASWITIIPENEHLLQRVSSGGEYLFGTYLENARNKVYRYNFSGGEKTEILLPSTGSVSGFSGKADDTLLFYSFSSFTYPGSIYSYNLTTGLSALYYQAKLAFNPEDYVSKQVFYPSKDGTEISLFVVHKKDLVLDGSNPCMLYGYGGFNISLTPSFSSVRLPWLENGGVFAMPNLRGGGEYGEKWHRAGMLLNKQNVFDDFIAAAEYLIKENYTSSEKLAISGRSNGGLLVGAVMTQRPDLMKVALPGVGVMDMLRYHQFTVGHGWVPEYGSSDEEVHFKNLISYSPLHHIVDGTTYPATLVFTGDHDDRVVPAHSFKFAATLQAANKGNNPVLIRIETKAGHGGGKPMSKLLDEEADKLAFTFYNLDITPFYP
jgi:prolyl oligopeptidase